MEHSLKTVNPYFDAVWEGRKPFEVRRNDRGFQAGDTLRLREYDPTQLSAFQYTRREVIAAVTYVLTGEAFGVKDGFCVMGLAVIERKDRL